MNGPLDVFVKQLRDTGILYSEAVREFRKRFIIAVLEANNGNCGRAAAELGMHRNTLSRTCVDLRINTSDFKPQRKPVQKVKENLTSLNMLAVFETCCGRFLVQGRYKGHEMYPSTIVCGNHGKRTLKFAKYVDERRLPHGIQTKYLTKSEERDLCLKTSSATS